MHTYVLRNVSEHGIGIPDWREGFTVKARPSLVAQVWAVYSHGAGDHIGYAAAAGLERWRTRYGAGEMRI